jgi:hypothetical protein
VIVVNCPFEAVVTPPGKESETVVIPFTTVMFRLEVVAFA